MTIWVKELFGKLTKETIQILVKKEINVEPFESLDAVEIGDEIILSNSDTIEKDDLLPFIPVIYEDFVGKMLGNISNEIKENYDYYYLKEALEHAMDHSVRTIILGSSYGLFGIDTDMLAHDINLSLSSQDLFYSFLCLQSVYKSNPHISTVVFCVGYYYFYSDLSQSEGIEISRVSNVYYPLFQTMHNAKMIPAKKTKLIQSDLMDIGGVLKFFSTEEFQKGYFNSGRPREMLALKTWRDVGKKWDQISEAEREKAGRDRALLHNKLRKYKLTYSENTCKLQQLVSFCEKKSIRLLFVVTPGSKSYRSYFDPGFKNDFYAALASVDGTVHLLDLFDEASFTDRDFNDADHLSDSGAEKMTECILRFVQSSGSFPT